MIDRRSERCDCNIRIDRIPGSINEQPAVCDYGRVQGYTGPHHEIGNLDDRIITSERIGCLYGDCRFEPVDLDSEAWKANIPIGGTVVPKRLNQTGRAGNLHLLHKVIK